MGGNMILSARLDTFKVFPDTHALSASLQTLHNLIRHKHPFIDRISVALYDEDSDLLKTLVNSTDLRNPLESYECKLEDVPSLKHIYLSQTPRTIHDLSLMNLRHYHSKAIRDSGYLSSYTIPLIQKEKLLGFLFFNSYLRDAFKDHILSDLNNIANVTTLLVSNFKNYIHTLLAALNSARSLTHKRDPETGAHIERMSRFSRLIAQTLSPKMSFDDEFIDLLFLFSPLHDLGKVAIPDEILLKTDKLTNDEFEIMKTHVIKGHEMLLEILGNFDFGEPRTRVMMDNIILYHHEYLDGTGYPFGLKQNSIPIEARIVTVADVFDAVTSERPYKHAWTNEEAFSHLKKLAGIKLDPDCVEALLTNKLEIECIQDRFRDN